MIVLVKYSARSDIIIIMMFSLLVSAFVCDEPNEIQSLPGEAKTSFSVYLK